MSRPRGAKRKKDGAEVFADQNARNTRRSSQKQVNYVQSDDEYHSEDGTEESEDDHIDFVKKKLSKPKLASDKMKNARIKKTKVAPVQESKSLASMFKPGNNIVIQSQLDLSDTDSDSCSDPGPSKISPPATSTLLPVADNISENDHFEESAPACDINLWKQNLEALETKPRLDLEELEEPTFSKKGKHLKKGVAKLLKLAGEKKEESSSEDENWEKIEEKVLPVAEKKPLGGNVEVTIDLKIGRRSKKERDLHEMLRLQVNRFRKQVQIDLHKASLVGALAHGYLSNKMLNDEILIGSALSVIPSAHCYPPKRTNLNYVEKLVKWFKQRFELAATIDSSYPNQQSLLKCISTGRANSVETLVFACVTLCRSLGILCRLVVVLQPLSSKVDPRYLEPKNSDGKSGKDCKDRPKPLSPNSDDDGIDPPKKGAKGKGIQSRPSSRKKKESNQELDGDGLIDHSEPDSADFGKKKRKTVSRQPTKPKQSNRKNITSDQDSADESSNKKKSSAKKRKSDEYLVSGKEPKKAKRIVSCWMEIYLEDEEQWTSVDVVTGKFHCDRHLERHAPEPMLYVVAFNPDTTWKDVTQRYASSFLSTTRKQRVDPDAWSHLLQRNTEAPSRRSKEEDETLQRSLVDQPLPTSISEYKAHPLYALKRHLLKFEDIYPANCTPLGFIRGEAVYARESVKNLHSRETWLKEAKVVRIGEKPYKVVKARPKWDRLSKKMVTDIPLELYGDWQVEDYVPPPAVNGQVPRNAYGNVELFLPRMLPKGTKHLQIPGLNKVARKLGIDCAPAMTGWDFHGGWSHPVYDGFVVCDEHVESLMDAWQEFNQEQENREREKREKRVYGNWRKLIRGLLIKQRLDAKYFSKLTEMDDFTNEVDATNDKPQSSNRCSNKKKSR